MYYFAYGVDLNKKQMLASAPESKPRFIATLPNYKLTFSGYSRKWRGGCITIALSRGDKVIGGIYEVSEKDLRRLDKFEDCPGKYDRINIGVFDEDGNHIEAVTHIRAGRLEETPPSKDYLAIIQQGYKDWRIF